MSDTLELIARKYNLDLSQPSPIHVPNRSRRMIARMLAKLGYKTGVEIGVERGEHAKILCDSIPDLELSCVDPWRDYPGYNHYVGEQDENFSAAREALSSYKVEFMRMFSMEAVSYFSENSLDFVYIDGGHDYQNVVNDLCEWTPKVRIGGIVYGHDYITSLKPGRVVQVKDAVDGYIASHAISPWFLFTEGADRYDRHPRSRIWLFVRQEKDFLIT